MSIRIPISSLTNEELRALQALAAKEDLDPTCYVVWRTPDGHAITASDTAEIDLTDLLSEAMVKAGKGRPLSEFVSDGRGPRDEGTITAIADFIQLMNDSGERYDLDGLVHDAASAIASEVNNGGVQRQLEWLIEQGESLDYIANCIGLDASTNPKEQA